MKKICSELNSRLAILHAKLDRLGPNPTECRAGQHAAGRRRILAGGRRHYADGQTVHSRLGRRSKIDPFCWWRVSLLCALYVKSDFPLLLRWVFWNFKMEKGAKISTQPGNVNGTVLNGILRARHCSQLVLG